jgi:uncharacterized RDD family membrane protein YckC
VLDNNAYEAQTNMREVISSNAVEEIVKYAGFWKRLAAYIIDSIVAVIVTYFVSFVGALLIGLPSREQFEGLALNIATTWICMIWLVTPWLYWALMESSRRRATLGKRALGIIVTDIEGRRITFARGTVRYWAKILSLLTLLIGFIIAGFTSRKQALHDIISNCLVVVKH